MDRDEIVKKIKEEEDYIRSPKFGNSLNKYLAKNPDGVQIKETVKPIGRLLLINEDEVEALYQSAVDLLREEMAKDDYYEDL